MNNVILGKKVVGAKQTLKVVKTGMAQEVYVAMDADVRITRSVIDACKLFDVEVIYVDSMKKLGNMVSIDVGAAIACVLKVC